MKPFLNLSHTFHFQLPPPPPSPPQKRGQLGPVLCFRVLTVSVPTPQIFTDIYHTTNMSSFRDRCMKCTTTTTLQFHTYVFTTGYSVHIYNIACQFTPHFCHCRNSGVGLWPNYFMQNVSSKITTLVYISNPTFNINTTKHHHHH